MWGELAILAAIIYGTKKLVDYNKNNEAKSEQKNNNEILNDNDSNNGDSRKELIKTTTVIDKINCEKVSTEEIEFERQYICGEFGCEFQCTNMKKLKEPSILARFKFFGRTYNGYNTLKKTELERIENDYSFKCDRIKKYMDNFGESVVVLEADVPCFDSGDRMFDSMRSLYFFQNSGRIAALYCAEGYQISQLYVFENLSEFNNQLIECLKNNGFNFN